ncbi:MAG: cytochrome c biogenesis protein CcsA [Phycisphaeraceae bacterium]
MTSLHASHHPAVALALLLMAILPGLALADAAAPQPHATHAEPDAAPPRLALEQLHELHHHEQAPLDRAAHADFAAQVDVSAFAKLAAFDGGRAKIVDTLAREELNRIYGKPQWRDPITGRRYDPTFTYLDMLFNKRYYFDKPVIRVEVLPLRQQLLQLVDLDAMFAHVAADDPALHARLTDADAWLRWGQIAPWMVAEPAVQAMLRGQGADLRLFDAQRAVNNSTIAFDQVGARLNMISPAEGRDRWHHPLMLEVADLPVSDPAAAAAVREQFAGLADAWQRADADAVNAALATLAEQLPQVNAATYPPSYQLQIESIYNATSRFTIGFWGYLLAMVALLIAFAVGRRWVAMTGLGLLLVGFAVHSAGIAARAVLTQRWPIHNQYESFVAVAWFGVLLGLVLMVARRQWLFGAAAAALGAVTLLTAHMIQIPSHEAGPVAAILTTSRILYIHVNVVLASYAMIALGFVMSLFYLGVHYFGKGGGPQPPAGGSGNGGSDIAMASGAPHVPRFAAAGVGAFDAEGDVVPVRGRAALLHHLDKAQLIVLQLAFWTLGVGIMLGAYWADHAWGRWWAWDPKETWALITWIVYLIAIHARLGVRNRGLVTAWLSVLGFFAMLWCYWGVNLLLAGLHSYA